LFGSLRDVLTGWLVTLMARLKSTRANDQQYRSPYYLMFCCSAMRLHAAALSKNCLFDRTAWPLAFPNRGSPAGPDGTRSHGLALAVCGLPDVIPVVASTG